MRGAKEKWVGGIIGNTCLDGIVNHLKAVQIDYKDLWLYWVAVSFSTFLVRTPHGTHSLRSKLH